MIPDWQYLRAANTECISICSIQLVTVPKGVLTNVTLPRLSTLTALGGFELQL
ncbi:hypothetical protein yfred0001_38970 [Yersinia frederiksenii ATCC 33641]|nr:hypothetical protein yfred0001_38970 [Yersinia frederiksenii ATCC 33641]